MTQSTFFVGQTTDGQWYAIRESEEPLFCLPCKSEAEGVRLGRETFEEYRRLFQGNSVRLVASELGNLAVTQLAKQKAYELREEVG